MQTMLNTALPKMMNELGVQENVGQWLVTIYFLMAGIVVPIAGFLIGKFSTRALFFASGGAFLTGTLLAAAGPDFGWILAGRLVQGVGAGLLMPLFQTTILRVFPKEKIGSAMGTVGLVMGLAPALGPVLSGLVVEHYSWRLLFYGILPIAAINLVLAYVCLKNVGDKNGASLDLRSVLYSTAGFAGLLYGLSLTGDQEGGAAWPAAVVLTAGAALVALFVGRQFRLAEPLLDFRLFRYRAFTHASWIGGILFFCMIGVELFLPLYAQKILGLSPRESGLMLLPGALLMGLSGLVSGRLYDRFGAQTITRTAFLGMTVTLLLLSAVSSFQPPIILLMAVFALFMVEIGLIMSPITAYTMANVPAAMIKHGSPMTIMLRSLSGSVSGAVLAAVLTSVSGHSSAVISGDMLPGIRVVFGILTAMAAAGLAISFKLEPGGKKESAPVPITPQ